jgi:hypothetical protein
VPEKELIVAGVDGARFDDALAIVAAGVEIPHLWPALILEAPEPTPYSYQHDDEVVDGVMIDLFERFEVWRVYIDPHKIGHLVERWQGRWGEKRVVEWRTNRPAPIAWAVRNFTEAIAPATSPTTATRRSSATSATPTSSRSRSRTTRAS